MTKIHLQLTPIELRRLFISDAIFQLLMGLKSADYVQRLLMMLNTSHTTAIQYYDIKNKVNDTNPFYNLRGKKCAIIQRLWMNTAVMMLLS